jgi:hypothetical protein
LSENAVVHHSKIVRRMTELGQKRGIDAPDGLAACPLHLR